MKNITWLTVLLFLFSCKKDKNTDCRFIQTDSFLNGIRQTATNYFFDDKGRVTMRIIHQATGKDTAAYRYTADSVVIDYGNIYSVYYLNSSGLATHSYTSMDYNPNSIRDDQSYTYDANGYLVSQRVIFSQLYLGTIVKDTQYYYFEIAGGNVVRTYGSNVLDQYYQYNNEPSDSRIPDMHYFPSVIGPFLGKSPVNLVAGVGNAPGSASITYTYKKDKDGRLAEKEFTVAGSTDRRKDTYIYDCD